MPGAETGVLPPSRREALLTTAAREFAGAGYQRASLNRIIRSCRMSKSSFYHYFDSKEALFDATVLDAAQRLLAALPVPAPADLAGPDFWTRIDELIAGAVRLVGPQDRMLWTLFYLPDAPTGPCSALARLRAGIDGWLAAALAAGRDAGAVRTDLPASLQAAMALAVLQAMDEWSLHQLDALSPDELATLVDAQLQALHRLVGH
ncbi:helix-turn-helix domain-containing protein [Actinocatenispora sera]|uniref:TetR/AcrR family transcriptional regulator n=1 Tax=Actinocatenispora sera TaxID=390989 RepID=UPI0033F59395